MKTLNGKWKYRDGKLVCPCTLIESGIVVDRLNACVDVDDLADLSKFWSQDVLGTLIQRTFNLLRLRASFRWVA